MRYHIRRHYKLYLSRCKEAGIEEHHWAIDRAIWVKMNAKTGRKQQTKLDGMFDKSIVPKEFTKDSILDAVAKFITVENEV